MDISLSDVGWVGGAILVFASLRMAWEYRADLSRAVKSFRRTPAPAPFATPPARPIRYVESAPPDTDTAPIPPVPDTGIGIDTARLASSLTEAQRLEVLALARGPKGKWIYSGKKLYTLFGGNYNDFVATMRRLRNGQDDDPPEEPTILTPIAGRPTKASYYPDQPDLEFQPPPS